MVESKGEIIEENHSIYSVLGVHLTGLIGIIMSLVWIAFILTISFVGSYKQPYFTDEWYNIGLILALIPAIVDLIVHALRFMYGRIQLIKGLETIKDFISGVIIISLQSIYPFNFGDYDPLISTILIIIGILSFISAFSNGYKFIIWVENDNKTLRKK